MGYYFEVIFNSCYKNKLELKKKNNFIKDKIN